MVKPMMISKLNSKVPATTMMSKKITQRLSRLISNLRKLIFTTLKTCSMCVATHLKNMIKFLASLNTRKSGLTLMGRSKS